MLPAGVVAGGVEGGDDLPHRLVDHGKTVAKRVFNPVESINGECLCSSSERPYSGYSLLENVMTYE